MMATRSELSGKNIGDADISIDLTGIHEASAWYFTFDGIFQNSDLKEEPKVLIAEDTKDNIFVWNLEGRIGGGIFNAP